MKSQNRPGGNAGPVDSPARSEAGSKAPVRQRGHGDSAKSRAAPWDGTPILTAREIIPLKSGSSRSGSLSLVCSAEQNLDKPLFRW
jgi:hypothetical protein